MNGNRPDATSRLDEIVREARDHWTPATIDDDALEAKVLAQVTADRSRLADEVRSSTARSRVLAVAVAVTAAAAAFIVVARRDPGLPASTVAAVADAPASVLRESEGAGEIRIGKTNAYSGHLLRGADVVEAEGVRAIFERPRKVVWLLEHDAGPARAKVVSAGESLVVELLAGALEAQVAPVATGEAFAVDVREPTGSVRIAVHGTHLRVARAGTRVVVDLNEGVVALGPPPRVGTTVGTLVTAPAHVELDVTDIARTLRVDHDPKHVQAPVPLAFQDPTTPPKDLPVPVVPPSSASRQAPPASAKATKVEAPKLPAGREAIEKAVRSCASSTKGRSGVHVTVTSTLSLSVDQTGQVDSARFDPPLQPEIQSCAASAIYKIKLDEIGAVTIPIEFSY